MPGDIGPVLESNFAGVRCYLYDMLHNTRQMISATGAVSQTMIYSAFGPEGYSSFLTNQYPFRQFQGEVSYDRDLLNLNYARNRFVDTTKGRWISTDPIGRAGNDQNLYRYVRNNPVNLVDPLGLATDPKAPEGYLGISVAAFITAATVAFGAGYFVGDNRGASPNDPRFRMELQLWVNKCTGQVINHAASTYGSTYVPWGGSPGHATANIYVDAYGPFSGYPPPAEDYDFNAYSSDPFFDIGILHFAPNAAVDFDITTYPAAQKIEIIMLYTLYPAFEVYVYDKGTATQLFVDLNPSGNVFELFLGAVKSAGPSYSYSF